jgi:alpha-L-arabinofuranosidase
MKLTILCSRESANTNLPTFFVALVLFVASASVLRAQLPNPAAYLTFDEGAGTVAHDSSGNNHNATLQGGAGWTAGLVGSHALSLPGTPGSYADIPTDVVDTTHSYTVAAWVKLNNLNGEQTFVSEDGLPSPPPLYPFPGPPGNESAFFLELNTSQKFAFTVPYDFFVNAQSGPSTPPGIPTSGLTPLPGQWYHLAGVYAAAAQSASLYVNGVLTDAVYNIAPRTAQGHTAIGHGQSLGSYTAWANGSIDDVRFYGQALSDAEILQIAKVGNPSLMAPRVLPAALQIDASQPGFALNPTFNGMMTEEINHSYDGGLYGELIQNRVFKDDATTPVHWSLIQANGGVGSIALDTTQLVPNTALTTSLKVTVSQGQRVGVANDGYWGIPIRPFTTYRASFWAKAAPGFTGPLFLDIESNDGRVVYARAQVPQITANWAKYTVPIQTFAILPTENTRYVVSTGTPGAFWLTQVSLFRPTVNQRPNGNRIDLMATMAGMKPRFLRFPGGSYLTGFSLDTRFDWKKAIGPIEQRPGHQGLWGYRSTDGEGLLEFLEWCEDLHMQPLLAVYAAANQVPPGPNLAPYVQDALDEIQYATGGTNTTWGARRAADGHPAPFSLSYVEIGNEDFSDTDGAYDARFAQFYDAIKATYPSLKIIATARLNNPSRTPDVIDDHYYATPRNLANIPNAYDPANFSRTGPKVFIGEWASIEGRLTPNLFAALGDAAFLTGLERNADVVILECYAPLLVNVNPGAFQWAPDLIGYDALRSYGSPSYYAQVMFDWLHGDVVLPTTLTVPGSGSKLYHSVTRDSQDGTFYLNLVNMAGEVQPLHVNVKGADGIARSGRALVLKGNPLDTNSLSNPYKVVPTTAIVNDLGKSFDYKLPPYSITVLRFGSGNDRKGNDYDQNAGHYDVNQD